MLKGEVHTINIINHYNYFPNNSKYKRKINLKLNSNTTIWELRCMIVPDIWLLPDQYKLSKSL